MTDDERRAAELVGGADALEDLARWCQQPDFPSAVYGFVSAQELMLRAAAMRAQLVLYEGGEGKADG